MHSIPKNQIVPNPDVQSKSSRSAQKRVVHEISSDEGSPKGGEVPKPKKIKTGKCKSCFEVKITRAETTASVKPGKLKDDSPKDRNESMRGTPALVGEDDEEDMHVDVHVPVQRKAEKLTKKPKKKKRVKDLSETKVETNNEGASENGGGEQTRKKTDKKDKKRPKDQNLKT